jgi:hypothetical protein
MSDCESCSENDNNKSDISQNLHLNSYSTDLNFVESDYTKSTFSSYKQFKIPSQKQADQLKFNLNYLKLDSYDRKIFCAQGKSCVFAFVICFQIQ